MRTAAVVLALVSWTTVARAAAPSADDIDDPKVALRPISGAFMTGDVDTFVRGLEMYRIARVEAETDGAVRLAGVDGASAEKYPN